MSARGERGRERRERERETESGGVITHSGLYTIPLCSLYRFCREQGPPHAVYICIGSSISIAPCSCATLGCISIIPWCAGGCIIFQRDSECQRRERRGWREKEKRRTSIDTVYALFINCTRGEESSSR